MLNNFVGEFLVLQGTALVNFRWAIFAAIGVILSACYMLWLYQRVFFGKASGEVSGLRDLDLREYAISVPLIILMVWMGTFTQSFIPSISTSTAVILGPVDAKRDVHVRNATHGALRAQQQQGVLPAKESVDAR
jgi:NADH-quinone oxidoreductase subunit M